MPVCIACKKNILWNYGLFLVLFLKNFLEHYKQKRPPQDIEENIYNIYNTKVLHIYILFVESSSKSVQDEFTAEPTGGSIRKREHLALPKSSKCPTDKPKNFTVMFSQPSCEGL